MWIVKLGGSWLSNPRLKFLMNSFKNFSGVPLTFVVGGGIFTDAVRIAQKSMKFEDELAHLISLKATENFAKCLQNILPFLKLTNNLEDIRDKVIKIWVPQKLLSKDKNFKKEWESTSDSIACWLAKKTRSNGVLFVKSCSLNLKKNLNIFDLQKKGILDKNLLLYTDSRIKLKIIGPEIIHVLENEKNWKKVLLNANEIYLNDNDKENI